MTLPLKWIGDQWIDWYYEKQDDGLIWIEKYEKKIWDVYVQTSIHNDENGYPVVVLRRRNDTRVIKLTEGVNYWSNQLNFINAIRHTSGFWSKKESKVLTFLVQKRE